MFQAAAVPVPAPINWLASFRLRLFFAADENRGDVKVVAFADDPDGVVQVQEASELIRSVRTAASDAQRLAAGLMSESEGDVPVLASQQLAGVGILLESEELHRDLVGAAVLVGIVGEKIELLIVNIIASCGTSGSPTPDVSAFTELLRLRLRCAFAQGALSGLRSSGRHQLDESSVAQYLGSEATRLLQSARDTAASIIHRAEIQAEQIRSGPIPSGNTSGPRDA